jgi:hypothetical protein
MSSPFWRRGSDGHIETTVSDTVIRGHLKFESPGLLTLLQRQISAVMASRVVDGIALRAWTEDSPQRVALAQAARRGVGRSGLVVIESGIALPTRSAPYVNGVIVVDDGKGKPVWPRYSEVCDWARDHIRKPSFTVLQTFATKARTQLYDMRMATTLALTFGEGYVTFGDSEGHDWYEFWSANLGRPTRSAYRKDGAYRREFQFGTVVFNPPTNPTVNVEFPLIHTSLAKSVNTLRVSVQPGDGDILISKPVAR